MSEMVERVAASIAIADGYRWEEMSDNDRAVIYDLARAAIAAMREPTMELLQDMPPTSAAIWKAMIDAALEPVDDD